MIKSDFLILYYQSVIDDLRHSLFISNDFSVKNSISLDIHYFLNLINDRIAFLNSHS